MKALVALALYVPAVALAQAQADREAEMFGAPTAAAQPSPSPPPADREAELFGAPPPTDREAEMFGAPPDARAPAWQPRATPVAPPPAPGALSTFADTLQVGGRLWLRSDVFMFEGTDVADSTFQMPNLLDVFLDARPNDRVRAFANFRLTYNPAGTDTPSPDQLFATPVLQYQLDQLWMKWDWGRVAFFTVGAQPVRWGTGRLWNPTDVLNLNRLDPLTPVDFRTGVPMARVRFPIEAIGGSLELIGDVAQSQTLGDLGAAARLQAVAGPTEWSLSARYRRNRPLMLGLDGSAGLGPVDVYAEAALSHGGKPTRWTGAYRLPSAEAIAAGPADALAEFALPTAEDRDDDWIPQVTVGLEYPIQYNDEDSLILGLEYFYNDAGYSDAALYPWLLQTGDFQPFYLGRHYAAAFLVLLAPGSWNDSTFILNALANLSDGTGIARLNVSHAVHRYLFIEPYVAVPFGEAGGEYRFTYGVNDAQVGWLADLGQPLPFEEGFQIPPGVFQAGLWLRVML